MLRRTVKTMVLLLSVLAIAAFGYIRGYGDKAAGKEGALLKSAWAAPVISSAQAPDTERKGSYYPGTEELAPDEMRVIALGTGMPNLTKAQKS